MEKPPGVRAFIFESMKTQLEIEEKERKKRKGEYVEEENEEEGDE